MSDQQPNEIVAPLLLIFATNQRLLDRALQGLSDTEYRQRSTERTNSVAWVAGHAVQSRAGILRLLGEPFDTGWGHVFDRGAEAPDPAVYPAADELLRMASDVGGKLQAHLRSLGERQLLADASAGPKIPGVKTVADQLGFLALHDSYHMGQLGYMRKALGHSSLVG